MTERSFRGRFCADVGDRLLYISFSNTLALVLRRSGTKLAWIGRWSVICGGAVVADWTLEW